MFIFLILILIFQFVNCNRVCDLNSFGCVGDGKTLQQNCVQKAFDSCDVVVVPHSKSYLTSGLNITRDDFKLIVDGTILGSTNVADFTIIPHLPSYPVDRG